MSLCGIHWWTLTALNKARKNLRKHVANRSGYLFPTASGKPLGQRNVLRALHATGKKVGFIRSVVRDFTASACSEDLTKLWLGHSKESVTDFHAGVYRRTWRGDRNGPSGWDLVLGYVGYKTLYHLLEQKQRK